MKRLLLAAGFLLGFSALAHARPNDRVVVKVIDERGQPVAGANVVTIEGASGKYLRQGIIWSDSNGVAVAEVGKDAFVGLRIAVQGFDTWRLDLAPGAPERRGKVIEVRLARSKGVIIPVSM